VGSTEDRDGVSLTNLDEELFPSAGATKRDLVEYLDAMSDRFIPVLRDRPLSVQRVLRGQRPFMQKNLPKYTPDWVERIPIWAESSHREVTYALCNDRRTLLWLANQRAVEFHPTLWRIEDPDRPTALILDIDPPEGDSFPRAVQAARLVRTALHDAGLECTLKTSGAKGLHVLVPITGVSTEQAAAATRALAARAEQLDPEVATTAFVREERHDKVFLDSTRAGGATLAALYSPRIRPGVPVSFPLPWEALEDVVPSDFTIKTAPALLAQLQPDSAADHPAELVQSLPADLIEQGRGIPIARVQAMHEGKRRARARRNADADKEDIAPAPPSDPG